MTATFGQELAQRYCDWLKDDGMEAYERTISVVADVLEGAYRKHESVRGYNPYKDEALAGEFASLMEIVLDNEYVDYGAGGPLRAGIFHIAYDDMDWHHLWPMLAAHFGDCDDLDEDAA